jgi:hypothetical protein
MQTSDADHSPASPLRLPAALLLVLTAPPLALAAWILLLFFGAGVVACLLVLVGILRVALATRVEWLGGDNAATRW